MPNYAELGAAYKSVGKYEGIGGLFGGINNILMKLYDQKQKREEEQRKKDEQNRRTEDERKYGANQDQIHRMQGFEDSQNALNLASDRKRRDAQIDQETSDKRRQPYEPQIAAVKSAYQQARDPEALRQVKALLLDIPEEFRPIKIEQVEQDIDNTHRRNAEAKAASALDEQRAGANAARKKYFEAQKSGDKKGMDDALEEMGAWGDIGNFYLYKAGLKQAQQEGGGGELSDEQKLKYQQTVVDPLMSQPSPPGVSLPKGFEGGTPAAFGISPGDSTLSNLLPTTAGIDRWASDFTLMYSNKLKEHAALWAAEDYKEDSPHNILDPYVKGKIAKEVMDNSAVKDKRPVNQKIMEPRNELTALDKNILLSNAVSAVERAATDAGQFKVGSPRSVLAQYVRSYPEKFSTQLAAYGLTVEDLINALGR